MRNYKVIVPTGYMASGSSVVTDLISEFEGYHAEKGSFEYVFLHCPNGVFDLEDKLLHGNNAIRSDEALHVFHDTMKQLYDKKYWWVGNYKSIIGESFWTHTQEYINDLTQYYPNFFWYYQENTNTKMFMQLLFNRIVKLLTFNKVKLRKPLTHPKMWISYIAPEEFYEKSRSYISKILKELGAEERNIILDQLLLPFNLHRVENYFDDNVEIFVVERDPRDVFLMNKYVYAFRNEMVPYPTDVYEFCKCYKKLREMEKRCEHAHVHRFKFEDFIYKYDETVERVRKILGENGELPAHLGKKTKFVPEKSINNTQVFCNKSEYERETKIIEEMLKDYLYDFPYQREGNQNEMF